MRNILFEKAKLEVCDIPSDYEKLTKTGDEANETEEFKLKRIKLEKTLEEIVKDRCDKIEKETTKAFQCISPTTERSELWG